MWQCEVQNADSMANQYHQHREGHKRSLRSFTKEQEQKKNANFSISGYEVMLKEYRSIKSVGIVIIDSFMCFVLYSSLLFKFQLIAILSETINKWYKSLQLFQQFVCFVFIKVHYNRLPLFVINTE